MATDLEAPGQYWTVASALATNEPFSIGAWVKREADEGFGQTIFSIADASADVEYYRFWLDSATPDVRARSNSASANGTATSTDTLTDGVWGHVGCAFVSDASRKVWVNGGTPVEETTSVVPVNLDRSAIGVLYRSSIFGDFDGMIAEVGMWNIELSTDNFLELADGAIPLMVRPDALIHYWPFIGAEEAIDIVGGANLTKVGTPTVANHPRSYRKSSGRVFVPSGAAPPAGDQEPSLIGGKLVNHGILGRHLVH